MNQKQANSHVKSQLQRIEKLQYISVDPTRPTYWIERKLADRLVVASGGDWMDVLAGVADLLKGHVARLALQNPGQSEAHITQMFGGNIQPITIVVTMLNDVVYVTTEAMMPWF